MSFIEGYPREAVINLSSIEYSTVNTFVPHIQYDTQVNSLPVDIRPTGSQIKKKYFIFLVL
jgi:hypothetical protein